MKKILEVLRKGLEALWQFFKVIHSGSEEGSSKRIYGGLIIIAMLILIYLVTLLPVPLEIWDAIETFVTYAFTIGATLLGLNTIIDIAKIRKPKQGGPPDGNVT